MPRHLLLIDDDTDLAAMVSEYLGSCGFQVETAYTGAQGLSALRASNFDAIILDLMLPDTSGFDLCREIRAESDTPIMMLTAKGEEMDRIIGLELGADDYLPKPFNPRELLARLNAIFRRSRAWQRKDQPLTFGELVIDPGSRSVSLAGEPCDLTGYQFDLLLTLARNAGRVMSRESLMDTLTGQDLESFDRSIDVHVSRIRAVIEADPKRPTRILTVRGVGYLFSKIQGEDHAR